MGEGLLTKLQRLGQETFGELSNFEQDQEDIIMPRGTWVFDPNAGGKKIPDAVKRRTEVRIRKHAEEHWAGHYRELIIRFRGQFCYIDALEANPWVMPDTPPEEAERLGNIPTHLCRLRYFGDEEKWGFAFYTYSHDKYEMAVFPSGEFRGSPEEAFDCAAQVYLR